MMLEGRDEYGLDERKVGEQLQLRLSSVHKFSLLQLNKAALEHVDKPDALLLEFCIDGW